MPTSLITRRAASMDNTWVYGHMPLNQRAKIFTSFSALKGFEELIREQENIYEEMPILSDDQYEDLNYAVSSLSIGDFITVKYYRDFHIKTVFGSVTKMSLQKREIFVDSKRICFDEMISIDI